MAEIKPIEPALVRTSEGNASNLDLSMNPTRHDLVGIFLSFGRHS
ncbi:hypothetical protein LbDm2_1383 [Levilactobacillus brevis]|nr:hypothetical protein LbDm2_1383 [Levilactobacillus brevis]